MQRAADGSARRVIGILGQHSVARDVCAELCRARGHELATPPQIHADPTVVDATILIDPRRGDWDRAREIGAPIIVVVDDTVSEQAAVDTLLAGADAVVATFDDASTIDRAIETVLAGETLLPRRLAQAVLRRLRAAVAQGPAVELTNREREILDSIVRGEPIKHTARTLGISVKTVQNLQSRLFRKLGARNRTQTVTRAHELGLVDPAP